MPDESTVPSPDDVREIFEGQNAPITNGALGAYIDAAGEIIADIEDEANASGISISTQRYSNLHKFAAAHMATVQAPLQEAERSESYRSDWLRESSYGEVVLRLDPSGHFADSAKSPASASTGPIRGRSRGFRRRRY